jgi:formate hydrogenlyase transcriptional activator
LEVQTRIDTSERLNSEIKRRKQAEQNLKVRLLFEELLSALSAKFVNVPFEQVDEQIHDAMREVLNFFKVDRFALLDTFPNNNSWIITHCVSRVGVPSVPVGTVLSASINPWAYEKLIMKREVLSFSKIDDLPAEADMDKITWIGWGIRSNLNIPIMVGDLVNHVIAINSIKRERVWPDELIPRLRLLGEIFVNAIERSKSQQALQKSEERLNLAVDSAEARLWEFDLSTDVVWITERGRKFYALAPGEELTFSRLLSLVHPEDRARILEGIDKAKTGENMSVEYRIEATPGNFGWIISRGRLCVDSSGKRDRIMGVSIDISERKQMESDLQDKLEEIKKLKSQLEKENIYLRKEMKTELGFGKIIGGSDSLQYVLFRAQKVAPTDATVLILGETGTGKGMVAYAIHEMSARKDKPMITINCAALPANLIESELFGREKGAFTGAHARQVGRFEVADSGTIFLDEIGELPLELQSKLLRVLQDGEFERLGSPRTIKVDVRVIASTSRDLKAEMRSGRFREDLYYRLNVFPVSLPPLRMRVNDIPELANHFIDKYAQKFGKRFETISKDTMQVLQAYHWPGNVRELEHAIERAVITSPEPVFRLVDQLDHEPVNGEEGTLQGFEAMAREHILQVLKNTSWKIEGKGGAAAILGLKPSTLRFRIKKLGIQRP